MKTQGLKKGDRVEVTITSLAPGGQGLTKELGLPIFVNRVARGDRVLVEIYDRRSDFAFGRVVDVLAPSSERVQPPCKLFKVCGGCQWQHINYYAQLEAKEEIIRQSLVRIGGMDSALVGKTIPADREFHYRNKVQFPVKQSKSSQRILAGYYEQNSHRLVNIKHCPIQPPAFDRMLEITKSICQMFSITAYNESSGQGLLRFVTARLSEATGQILITLVVNCSSKQIPTALTKVACEIINQLPQVVGVCANLNTKPGNRIMSEETVCLAGKPYIEEVFKSERLGHRAKLRDGLTFRLSPDSFFQVNTLQAIKLLEKLDDLIGTYLASAAIALKEMVLVDAYAGVGVIALWLSPFFKDVIAIEENASAVKDGQLNLRNNKIDNVEFLSGEVEYVLPRLIERGVRPEVVVLDPPRKGCSEKALGAVLKLAPALILYVSCNPVTLARDLRFLMGNQMMSASNADNDQVKKMDSHLLAPIRTKESTAEIEADSAIYGYKTKEIIPIDLFPQTYHVEAIAVLYRQKLNG